MYESERAWHVLAAALAAGALAHRTAGREAALLGLSSIQPTLLSAAVGASLPDEGASHG